MMDWIYLALRPHFHLGWNLFLALVPLGLALWLFRRTQQRGWLWWPLFVAFILFLPNAAYTLTDIIHFIDEVRDEETKLPEWSVAYIVIPKYALFIFLGFQAHVISLILVGNYLRWRHHRKWVVFEELALNFLCAIGVFWGRYLRLNTWDIVTKPQRLAHQAIQSFIADHYGALMVLRYFVIISVLYYFVKFVDLAVWEFVQHRRKPLFAPAATAHPTDHVVLPPVE
ncbi:MAG TPA: DUF1361 domain-containing protein [Pirellulales bacterium]|jgi:uncharacterized membrane protein|nr:DUF1361 domain-containing protein [Pirellulales bacterium]